MACLIISRLKDMNQSPYLALIYFVPAFIGDLLPHNSDQEMLLGCLFLIIFAITFFFTVVLMFFKSVDTDLENHTNKYGKNPLFKE